MPLLYSVVLIFVLPATGDVGSMDLCFICRADCEGAGEIVVSLSRILLLPNPRETYVARQGCGRSFVLKWGILGVVSSVLPCCLCSEFWRCGGLAQHA